MAGGGASHTRLMRARLWIAACSSIAATAQTIDVDWSSVAVDAAGHASAFGPRVHLPEDDTPSLGELLGYFRNEDGFFGRPGVEYVRVQVGPRDELEALKLVGDSNVPRGKLTWRTAPAQPASWTMPVQLNLRDDVTDPEAFEWSPGDHEVRWSGRSGGFQIVGPNPRGTLESEFVRVSEREALDAARTLLDLP